MLALRLVSFVSIGVDFEIDVYIGADIDFDLDVDVVIGGDMHIAVYVRRC